VGILDRLKRSATARTARPDEPITAAPFFVVQPETAGARLVGTGSASVCVFDTWLGDDLVRVHPALLTTTPLRNALAALRPSSGFTFDRARVRRSPFYRRFGSSQELPVFWHVQVHGAPGRDDMGLTSDRSLVVSWRVLRVLADFRVGRAVFAKYDPPPDGTRTSTVETKGPRRTSRATPVQHRAGIRGDEEPPTGYPAPQSPRRAGHQR
jgi:hypothetical protein